MDWEYIKQHGYSAWQVIPLFFVSYIGMVLLFGGCAQIAWQKYYMHPEHEIGNAHAAHFHWWTESMWVLICGAFVLTVAVTYCIVVCLVVPMMKRKQRTQHILAPEPEAAVAMSVDDQLVDNWFQSTSQIEAQDYMESSQHTVQLSTVQE